MNFVLIFVLRRLHFHWQSSGILGTFGKFSGSLSETFPDSLTHTSPVCNQFTATIVIINMRNYNYLSIFYVSACKVINTIIKTQF